MGFGSYDESEQEQPDEHEEDDGENVTEDFKQAEHDGSSEIENTVDEMIDQL